MTKEGIFTEGGEYHSKSEMKRVEALKLSDWEKLRDKAAHKSEAPHVPYGPEVVREYQAFKRGADWGYPIAYEAGRESVKEMLITTEMELQDARAKLAKAHKSIELSNSTIDGLIEMNNLISEVRDAWRSLAERMATRAEGLLTELEKLKGPK